MIDVPHYTPDYSTPWNEDHVEVAGSYGIFLVEKATGTILAADYYGSDQYRNILRFDPVSVTSHQHFLYASFWSEQPDGSELYEKGNPEPEAEAA